jgi:hypothetical protein
LYQGQWALLELIRGSKVKPDCRIAIELFDDVAWEASGSPVELLQLKHRLKSARPLSDLHADVWKTFAIWLDSGPPGDLDGPLLTLVTTQSAAEGSALSCLRPPTPDHETALRLLEDAAKRSTAVETSVERRRFLDLDEVDRRIFISRIRLLDSAPAISSLDAQVRRELLFAFAPRFEDETMQRLWGWWYGQVLDMLQRRRTSVGAVELHLFLDDVRAGYAADNLPTYEELRLQEDEIGTFSGRTFVHQLRWVSVPEPILRTAILDYYRAYSHTAKWITEDLVGIDELKRFETALKDEWERAFAWVVSELPTPADEGSKERIGRELLQRTLSQITIRVRDRYSEPFYSRGKHHDLADHGQIGWHPDFESKLRELLLGATA